MTAITVAKTPTGRLVQVVRVAKTVGFSKAHGWVCITPELGVAVHKQTTFKWVPATTPFVWVRTFAFGG
jgi:hypothetical protein